MPNNAQTTARVLISYARKVMFKILPSSLQARFRKGSGTRDQIVTICWIIEKVRELKKKSNSASLTMLKPLTV